MLTQLVSDVSETWEVDNYKCHLWTDSTVVLNWSNSPTNRLKSYVGNRINQILEITYATQ